MDGRIRVIGIGNPYRRDDGAGLCLAQALGERLKDRVEVLEHSGEGASLMQAWVGADAVLICDAVVSGSPAGTVHRVDVHSEAIPRDVYPCSTHEFGVWQAIELGRVLGTLPRRLVFWGIEGEDFQGGEGCSAEVEAGIEEAVKRAAAEVGDL